MGFGMCFLFAIEKMDGDEHTLNIILKVLGMLCILLDLTPFLSLYAFLILILMIIFVFRLFWKGCNFVNLTDLQYYTY